MASNVSDSCRVWNCKVTNPEEIVGPLGDLEHMASYLGEGETLKEGKIDSDSLQSVNNKDEKGHEITSVNKTVYHFFSSID